jgi:CheY-like chemotaxis protein
MPPKQDSQLLKVLKRIPVLASLSPTQLQAILGICTTRTLQEGDWLFERDDPAEAMYVLLKGVISLLRADGVQLARFEPIAPLGELGIVSSRPRRLSARAAGEATLLVLPRKGFDLLMNADARMSVTVYRNLILLLAERVDEDNVRAFEHEELRSRLLRVEDELRVTREVMRNLQGDPEAVSAAVDEHLRETQPTILVVDDEAEVCIFLSRALAEYDVVTATNGVEALRAAEERPPALVISDVNMPEMDGLQLLTQLKERRPDLPVIGLSGYVREEAAANLEFDVFLFKPMRVAQLRSTVKEQLAGCA